MEVSVFPYVVLPLGLVTSCLAGRAIRFLWDKGIAVGKRLSWLLVWYACVGTLAFSIVKSLETIAVEPVYDWVLIKWKYCLPIWAYAKVAGDHCIENRYPLTAAIATLCLVYFNSIIPTKMVDDLGNRKLMQGNDGSNLNKARQANSQFLLTSPKSWKILVKPDESTRHEDTAVTNSALVKTEAASHKEEYSTLNTEDVVAFIEAVQLEIRQLKEVVVSLSMRIDEMKLLRTSQRITNQDEQEVGVYAAIEKTRRKRAREPTSGAPNGGLTQQELMDFVGKSKRDLLEKFKEDLREEAARRRDPEYLTKDEAELGMKDLSQLDIQWRKSKGLAVKDLHHRSIGVLKPEQAQLRRREIIEIIRGRRNEDFAVRMKEKGSPVMKCSNCNQYFLVERGHRCYIAQWNVRQPRGPLPVERKIVISQTGGGAVQVKPVTQVDISKLDNKIKRLQDYRLVHEKAVPTSTAAIEEVTEAKTNKEDLVVAIDDEQLPSGMAAENNLEMRVNKIEAEFQAIVDGVRSSGKKTQIPFQKGIKAHESPTEWP